MPHPAGRAGPGARRGMMRRDRRQVKRRRCAPLIGISRRPQAILEASAATSKYSSSSSNIWPAPAINQSPAPAINPPHASPCVIMPAPPTRPSSFATRPVRARRRLPRAHDSASCSVLRLRLVSPVTAARGVVSCCRDSSDSSDFSSPSSPGDSLARSGPIVPARTAS